MSKRIVFSILIVLTSILGLQSKVKADYWLVIGSYRQGPGGRPEVSGITSPSLFAIPMDSIDQCEEAGREITRSIYKPVWQFDNKWTCVKGASN